MIAAPIARAMEICRRLHLRVNWRQAEAGVEDEMRFHLELRTEANRAEGMSAEEATRAARERFGDRSHFRDECRRVWGRGLSHSSRERAHLPEASTRRSNVTGPAIR